MIERLGSADAAERESARRVLIEQGTPAIGPLIDALSSAQTHIRWEAAKALEALAPPDATIALVSCLEDRDEGVRWVASEALAAIGRPAFAPLLQALVYSPKSEWLRQGAHHVLHHARLRSDPISAPLLAALESEEPELKVPPAAYDGLRKLGVLKDA